jgi:hypothetical protein
MYTHHLLSTNNQRPVRPLRFNGLGRIIQEYLQGIPEYYPMPSHDDNYRYGQNSAGKRVSRLTYLA